MSKDYNIDDILSEVNKRREENEKEIKARQEILPEADEITVEDVITKAEEDAASSPVAEPEEEAEIKFDFSEEAPQQTDEEPQAEPESVTEQSTDTAADVDMQTKAEEPLKEEYIDLNNIDLGEPADNVFVDPKPYRKKKIKKIVMIILCILLVFVIAGGIGAYFYVENALNKVTTVEPADNQQQEDMWTGMDQLVENFDPIEETDASELSSLQDMIKTWYYNGAPASSTHVLNVMLIGEDTRGTKILDDGTRADAAILASINIDKKTIKLTSILRDTYAYWETTEGDKSTGRFGKINGAMSTGDVKTYCTAIENLYKVKIDNYVIVNFDSFESIINTLGGVEIEISAREINEINSHQKRYGHVTIEKEFDGKKGKQLLNGKQALAYCRIRKLDSDNMRANRQKTCLNQVFKKMKGASNVKLLKVLNEITPYVKTDMPKATIVKLGKYALSKGWMNYDVEMSNLPEYRNNERGAGGKFYGAWCWKADFPQDAYMLQMDCYGKSNITLARTRVDYINCKETGFYSEGSYPVRATTTNDNYGEVTTRPTTTKKETTTAN